jgi:receptor expression-enhancing protein 5/6
MQYVSMLDKELAKYPSIVNLERSTGVPKAYAVIGAASLYLFLILLNLGGQLLTNVAGFAIPGYYSMAALFTSNTDDDTQWLTYWVVFSFFSVIESFVSVVYWFPFYYTFKFIFLLWLSLPMFRYVALQVVKQSSPLTPFQRSRLHLPVLHGPHVRPLLQQRLDRL